MLVRFKEQHPKHSGKEIILQYALERGDGIGLKLQNSTQLLPVEPI